MNDTADPDILRTRRYYNKDVRNAEVVRVCPFSALSRMNRCLSHGQPRARTESIRKHLIKVRDNGGDEFHPLADPLWDTSIVQYILSPRPPKLAPQKRKLTVQETQRMYYTKRRTKQALQPDVEARFAAGEISKVEVLKVLIGDRRRKFITGQKVMAELKEGNERKRREDLERMLAEYRLQQSQDDPIAAQAAADAVARLEASQRDLNERDKIIDRFQVDMSSLASNAVSQWASEGFLESELPYLEHHKYPWPASGSYESFYRFATLLLPRSLWNGRVWNDSHMRRMHLELSDFIHAESDSVDEDELEIVQQNMNALEAIFNASCDIVKGGSVRMEQTVVGAEQWLASQDQMWDNAKKEFAARTNLDDVTPLTFIRMVDKMAVNWRALREALIDKQHMHAKARATADGLS
jgi:hypothetical protein